MTSTESIGKKAIRKDVPGAQITRVPDPARVLMDFFSSLKLTVVFLSLGLLLVFIGTLAQVDEGLYDAQHRYFRSFFIWGGPHGASWHIPVFPGGYLIGGVLLVNLLAAHARRFKFSKKKIGILVIHAGLILLLVGQLATDLLSNESSMRLEEGESKNYSESGRTSELVFIDESNPQFDRVVSIPQNHLKVGHEIRQDNLPFFVRVKNFFPNSRVAQVTSASEAASSEGSGKSISVRGVARVTDTDHRDIPSAVVELVSPRGSLGTWLVSDFLDDPQTVSIGDKQYKMSMRFLRHYKPYSIQLLQFTHERYKGTDIPKNFASRVRVEDGKTKEAREVLIYMNNPLRYAGATFYQAGFDENNDRLTRKVTILQVVENPSWLTPYLSCIMVGAGLITQFMSHLVGFVMKRKIA